METTDNYQLPKPDKADIANVIIRAVISAIPSFGGPALEIFNYLVGSPLEKRRESWMKVVAEGLRNLEKNKGIKLEELQTNETFITILIQATSSVFRSHQSVKKEALRNAVINTATGINIKDENKELFIRYVDELMPSHLLLLSYLLQNESILSGKKTYGDLYEEYNVKFPGSLNKDEFKMLFEALSNRSLLQVSDSLEDHIDVYYAEVITTEFSPDDLPRFLVTSLGNEFINFITEHDN